MHIFDKYYQIIVSVIILIDMPLAYIALKLGYSPISVFVINVFINLLAFVFRLVYSKKYVNISLRTYSKKVILPCLGVVLLVLPISLITSYYLNFHWIVQFFFFVIVSISVVFIVGLETGEKKYLRSLVYRRRI